eukprot:UN06925
MMQWSVSSTTDKNNNKHTTYTEKWYSSGQTSGTCSLSGCERVCGYVGCTYNGGTFHSPCSSGSCSATHTNDAKAGPFGLAYKSDTGFFAGSKYYSAKSDQGEITDTPYSTTSFSNWQNLVNLGWSIESTRCGLTYLTGYAPTSCSASAGWAQGDAKVNWKAAGPKPQEYVSVLAKQKDIHTIERYKSSKDYEIVYVGYKSSDDMIAELRARVEATVWVCRVLTFFGLWLGYRLLASVVDLFTDWLPCGINEVFDMLLCAAACVPAFVTWFIFFAIAWLTFRPIIGGPILAAAICLCVGYGYYSKKKGAERKQSNAPYQSVDSGSVNNNQNNNAFITNQTQQQYQPQQQQYQPPQQQQQQYRPPPQQQYQPQQQQYHDFHTITKSKLFQFATFLVVCYYVIGAGHFQLLYKIRLVFYIFYVKRRH